MKKIITILLLLLIFSCKEGQNSTLDYLNAGLDLSTESIINFSNDEKNKISAHSYESDLKKNKYKQSFDKTNFKTQQIQDLLYEITASEEKPKSKDIDLKDYSKKLHQELHSYVNFIDSLVQADTIELPNYISDRSFILNQDNQFSKYEIELIKSKIGIMTYHIFKHYSRRIIIPYYKLNKLKIAVFPKSTLLKTGELYEAEIRFFAYDSLAQFEAIIENKHVQSKNGMAFYIDSSFNNAGDIHKTGTLKIKDPYDEYYRDYPFTINYKIIKP